MDLIKEKLFFYFKYWTLYASRLTVTLADTVR